MPTIPTGKMERELRRLYMRWVHQLPKHEHDLHNYVAKFQRQSIELIERMGGDVARLGALADFPAPKRLDLSLHVGTIYSDMELAAISAQIGTGLNPTDTARALVRAGVDKSYRRLERLARTETVRAYWKNAWDSIDGLDLVMVWGAERGPRTCEWCLERDGLVLDGPDIRDHPNGRCTPIPMLPSQVDYRGSVRADGQIYQDPAWTKKPVSGFDDEYNSISDEEALALSAAYDDLEFDQQMAVKHYQGKGYKTINKALRSGSAEELASQSEVMGYLDAAMKPLDRNVTLKRGQGWETMLRDLGIDSDKTSPSSWDIEGKIGTVLSQPGYYSTTISQKVANDFLKDHGFLIDVEVPKGVGAHFVQTGSPVLDMEKEMLLQRGLDFVLTKADLVANPRDTGESVWRITLRAVPK